MGIKKAVLGICILIFTVSCDTTKDSASESLLGLISSASSTLIEIVTSTSSSESPYLIGTGISDITGPPAEVMFAGYCDFEQLGTGVYMRQWARAFIIKEKDTGNSVVMVTADIPLMSVGVYVQVLKMLRAKYGDMYNEKNIIMSATHTHSGPGGYFKTYALNIFAGLTFHDGNFKKIAAGIFNSIVMAHDRLASGKVFISSGEFPWEKSERINRNRSAVAYALNRDADDYLRPDGQPDNANRTMTQFRFVRDDGTAVGMYHWAPIHPNVSGSHLNLINGDINGLASYMIEKEHGVNYIDNTNFVAAFAYTDAADTSSNLPEDALLPQFAGRAKTLKVDANGNVIDWIADGTCDYERMQLRADTVCALARDLYDGDGKELAGSIECRQLFAAAQSLPIKPEYIDDRDIYYADVLGEDKTSCRLCNGSAGVGFFAGSMEDGDSGMVKAGEGNPRDVTDYSIADIYDLSADPVPAIADILFKTLVPGPKLRSEMDCQLEKRITLSFDELNNLVPGGKAWSMNQPIQIVKIGTFAILALPCEVTTMSGRRLKADVKKVLTDVEQVMINSTSNDDLRYLSTREEYASQQYEGGATMMGPYSLNGVRQIVSELAATFTPGVEPPPYAVDLAIVEAGLEKVSILQVAGNVLFDDKPLYKKFGDVITQPAAAYSKGSKVSAVFWGAHPNNNLTVGSSESYLVVEKKNGLAWKAVAHDWDPSTRYIWKRDSVAYSRVTIEWYVPGTAGAGEYRLRHVGYWKSGWTGKISRYEGVTKSFLIN